MSLAIKSNHIALPMVGNATFYSQAEKTRFCSDIQFDASNAVNHYYRQFFRARTSGEFIVDQIEWECTDVIDTGVYYREYTDDELDGLFHIVSSGNVPLYDVPSNYIVRGTIIGITYYKTNASQFRLRVDGYFRAGGGEITGVSSYNYENIRAAAAAHNEFGTFDLLVSSGNYCDYADKQAGDYIRYTLRPDAYPTIVVRNNTRSNPAIEILSEELALAAYGEEVQFSIATAEYLDWTSIGNGLRAKGFFVYGYDIFWIKEASEAELQIISMPGDISIQYASSFTEYQSGVTSSYWRYYGDRLKAYCRHYIDEANANGAHYNTLYLITSKSCTVGNSVWKIVIKSSTSGENDIVINDIAFSTLRYLFEESSTHDDKIIPKGRGFSYTYSTDYIYSSTFDGTGWGGGSTAAEIRIADAERAIATYGLDVLFTFETDDFADWMELNNGGLELRGFFVKDRDCYMLHRDSSSSGSEDTPTTPEYVTVTFDAETNGGTCGIGMRKLRQGTRIGTLPIATKIAHVMTGWFTNADGGSEIDADTIINENIRVFAHFVVQITETTLHKRMFPYLGSMEKHDILMQTRPKELDPALGNTFRVVVRGYFRNPQENGSDKHLGLYVLGSYDYKNWQLYGWKEKRLSDAGFHDIGCETYRASMKYIMVILTGQLADGSHIDKIDMTGIGRYNNKLK